MSVCAQHHVAPAARAFAKARPPRDMVVKLPKGDDLLRATAVNRISQCVATDEMIQRREVVGITIKAWPCPDLADQRIERVCWRDDLDQAGIIVAQLRGLSLS